MPKPPNFALVLVLLAQFSVGYFLGWRHGQQGHGNEMPRPCTQGATADDRIIIEPQSNGELTITVEDKRDE